MPDAQQAVVLRVLESSDEPVSFAELEARGVSRPATIVYELEAAG